MLTLVSDSQKHLTTSLLTLLSHSHSSTSSLLAYTTSSPGVLLSVRRAVRYSAFEGPISPSLHEPAAGSTLSSADTGTPGWAAYIASLEQFRKDLKQIHLLEEEMSRVKRDREILVTRLIKTTKSRPTKSDIKDIANSYSQQSQVMSSGGSTYSAESNMSADRKESKRAGKLAEAQAELLGCEEHLRSLEIRIESERNKVMYRGLEERFRAMEVVAQMWLAQAHRGLEDLEKLPNLPVNAYELDSNGSLAPSQSASQVGGYDDHGSSPRRPIRLHDANGPGSITDSIQEEEEGESSGEEQQGTLVMHENRPTQKPANGNPSAPAKSSPLSPQHPPQPNYASPSGPPPVSSNQHDVGRRAVSEVARAPRSYSPVNHAPLRRTLSNGHQPIQRVTSPAGSSVRSRGSTRKRGFFAAIARFFKGPSKGSSHHQHGRGGVLNRRDGRESPPYGASRPSSAWQTRTNDNLNRSRSVGRRTRSDSSSDEEDMRNLVQVSNHANHDTGFSVADIGRVPYNPNPKANPVAITRSASTKSKSTVTTRSVASGAATPKARPTSQAGTTVSRSNTVKSTASTVKTTATAKSSGTIKSTTKPKAATANGTTERNRKNGSIARSASTRSNGPTIMSIIESAPPPMPDVPKAPRSLVNPQLEVVKAPGSSLTASATMPSMILPSQVMNGSVPRTRDALGDELRPQDSISRSNSYRRPKSTEVPREEPRRPVSPLPPSKSRQPPLKSALRPSSPSPLSPSEPPPVITTLYSISAPGPVELPPDEPHPRPSIGSRPSYASTADQTSIYESAVEDEFHDVHDQPEETDDDESTELGDGGYQVVENDRLSKSPEETPAPIAHAQDALPDLPPQEDGAGVVRRKSVRMNLPASASMEHLAHTKGVFVAPPQAFEDRPYDRSYTAPEEDDSPPGSPRASGQ